MLKDMRLAVKLNGTLIAVAGLTASSGALASRAEQLKGAIGVLL